MAEDGIPEILAEQRLGHQVPGMRGLYAHVSDRMRDEAAEVGFKAEAIYSLMRRERAHEGVDSRFPFVQPFEFGIIGSLVMRASVAVGGVELAAVTFYVRDQPPQKAIGS
jgi:hypothetical protein